MDLIALTNGLIADEEGVWKGKGTTDLSYPEQGNLKCYQLEDASFWFKHRNECITSAIKSFPPEGAILDVGGGNGYVTRKLLDEGFDAILLEPGSSGAINGKIHRHIPEVICATLTEANFEPASLGAIGCFDVIEHIEDDLNFIEQVHQVLAPGGLLYATVPAHQWLWSQSDVSAQHHRRYNEKKIRTLLGDQFEVERFTYFFSALTPVIYLLRTLPFKLKLFRSGKVLSTESEHGVKKSAGQGVMDWLLRRELNALAKGESRQFGASCLFVARKIGPQEGLA